MKAHQATTVDGAMAAKLDKLLAGMDAMEKRMSALEQRQRGPGSCVSRYQYFVSVG